MEHYGETETDAYFEDGYYDSPDALAKTLNGDIRESPTHTCFPSMAFIHRHSFEGVKSELDLFAVPPTQTSIDQGGLIEHQPITSLDSGGPI